MGIASDIVDIVDFRTALADFEVCLRNVHREGVGLETSDWVHARLVERTVWRLRNMLFCGNPGQRAIAEYWLVVLLHEFGYTNVPRVAKPEGADRYKLNRL